jgi:hypothetical protein
VAKVARVPGENWVLNQEYALVAQLRQEGTEFMRSTIPNPLVRTLIADHCVVVEPYFPGPPMSVGSRRTGRWRNRRSDESLDRAIDWLLQCQKETMVQRAVLTEEQLDTYILSPIDRLRETATLRQNEWRYLEALKDRTRALIDHPLPLVFKQGDFRPDNILMDADTMHVIDWECGNRVALPLMDVFSLLIRVYAQRRGWEDIDGYLDDYLEVFAAVFLKDGAFSQTTRTYVDRASHILGIEAVWLEPLLALFFVTEANKFHAILDRCAQRGYLYLLRSRDNRLCDSYSDQLDRQKHVWLLGHMITHRDALIFGYPSSLDARADVRVRDRIEGV